MQPRAKKLGSGISGQMCWNLEKEEPLEGSK